MDHTASFVPALWEQVLSNYQHHSDDLHNGGSKPDVDYEGLGIPRHALPRVHDQNEVHNEDLDSEKREECDGVAPLQDNV